MAETFSDAFTAITGNPPFPWQTALFSELVDDPFARTAIDLPTGLGKTSIIAIWMLALAHRVQHGTHAGFPRRLIYVVNRRTVVDQATGEAEKLRNALYKPALQGVRDALIKLAVPRRDETGRAIEMPLAISTLRGELADNPEWRDDPARAAVIVGTVDMIGSRLLFAGYGLGMKSRPLHAGFLGQEALLVHDEAHLEPAFQELLTQIEGEQQRCGDFRRLQVMALSATARDAADRADPLLSDADRTHPEVGLRLNAKKALRFHEAAENGIAAKMVECALAHKDSGQAILIYVQRLDDVAKVRGELEKKGCKVQQLTGTMRGLERERLVRENLIFRRFLKPDEAHPEQTVYLICTSAGEVGIDMSADHLVCDLTPFDSMAQRFGRVNRFGKGDAQIDVVHERAPAGDKKKNSDEAYETARTLTLELLRDLPEHSASPAALATLRPAARAAAFTPPPTILPATEILFDAWALTTAARDLPGRPPVEAWLHGVEASPPETRVAWREEVEVITDDLAEEYPPEELLEEYPLKPHELLRDRFDRVFDGLERIAKSKPDGPVWITDNGGKVERTTLGQLVKAGKDGLSYTTIILPPEAGGLGLDGDQATGFLDGKCEYRDAARGEYDVADRQLDMENKPRRRRVWDAKLDDRSMRLVVAIDTRPDADEQAESDDDGIQEGGKRRYWYWYERLRSADGEGSRNAPEPQELQPHLRCAGDFADQIVRKLALTEPEGKAVRLAARWHDLGKARSPWQRAIGNRDYPRTVLAKSGNTRPLLNLKHYRHELGSLIDLGEQAEFKLLEPAEKDLVLHLIAAHHGRARPHFPLHEVIDPERQEALVAATAREIPRRFARLQRKYGRWGLAYLESLVRAADIMASQQQLSQRLDLQPEASTEGAR